MGFFAGDRETSESLSADVFAGVADALNEPIAPSNPSKGGVTFVHAYYSKMSFVGMSRESTAARGQIWSILKQLLL